MARPTVIKVLQKTGRFSDPTPFAYAPGYVFVHDAARADYDWLVVYDEFERPERLRCPREQTILCTWEPVSIKGYSRAYTRQFGHLLTNRPLSADGHPHPHLGRGYFYWFNDRTLAESAEAAIPPKTRLVSAVCSSKRMTRTAHQARFRLVETLAREIPELDWFGHGVRSFGKKHEVMDPYRYHVAVENHIGDHHWTEKLSDALLSECLPFYAGDPALAEALPEGCVIPIPIGDPQEAVRIARRAFAEDAYGRRIGAVREAKRLILTKYNFWAQVIEVIEGTRGQRVTAPGRETVVWPRRMLRLRSPLAAWEDATGHLRRFFGIIPTT